MEEVNKDQKIVLQALLEKESKEIFEIRRILKLNGMEKYSKNLVYMPLVPMLGITNPFILEEIQGVKVARLISPSDD